MAGNTGVKESEEFVYRISTADEWSELQTSKSTFGQQLDKDSGFIHLSKLNQASLVGYSHSTTYSWGSYWGYVKSTLERFYLGTTKDLFLLQIDCEKLGDGLIYEEVDESNVFPHFYGPSRSFVPLTFDMVVKAERLILSNGQFICSMLN